LKQPFELYQHLIVQIATPYATGIGFFLKSEGLIITNEQIVRDNATVVIHNGSIPKQRAKVLFTNPKSDLAFLEGGQCSNCLDLEVCEDEVADNQMVTALGQGKSGALVFAEGQFLDVNHVDQGVPFYKHSALLNITHSGGPLLNAAEDLIGINAFQNRGGETVAYCLPASTILDDLEDFKEKRGEVATRCFECGILSHESDIQKQTCPQCKTAIFLPSDVEAYEPVGVAATIENLLTEMGQNVEMARIGPNTWEIQEGSALINITYYERTGLIMGDATLCSIPPEKAMAIHTKLLQLNYDLEGLTFSVKDQDIILSLLIYDRYLDERTGLKLLQHLFEQADYYDNVLVEEHGAVWK